MSMSITSSESTVHTVLLMPDCDVVNRMVAFSAFFFHGVLNIRLPRNYFLLFPIKRLWTAFHWHQLIYRATSSLKNKSKSEQEMPILHVSKPQLGREKKKQWQAVAALPSAPYHNAQHDPLAGCFRLTKCWIYESLNEYIKEGGFTSCCGDLKCFCLAFAQTRWHWIFMICLNLQRVGQTSPMTTT